MKSVICMMDKSSCGITGRSLRYMRARPAKIPLCTEALRGTCYTASLMLEARLGWQTDTQKEAVGASNRGLANIKANDGVIIDVHGRGLLNRVCRHCKVCRHTEEDMNMN